MSLTSYLKSPKDLSLPDFIRHWWNQSHTWSHTYEQVIFPNEVPDKGLYSLLNGFQVYLFSSGERSSTIKIGKCNSNEFNGEPTGNLPLKIVCDEELERLCAIVVQNIKEPHNSDKPLPLIKTSFANAYLLLHQIYNENESLKETVLKELDDLNTATDKFFASVDDSALFPLFETFDLINNYNDIFSQLIYYKPLQNIVFKELSHLEATQNQLVDTGIWSINNIAGIDIGVFSTLTNYSYHNRLFAFSSDYKDDTIEFLDETVIKEAQRILPFYNVVNQAYKISNYDRPISNEIYFKVLESIKNEGQKLNLEETEIERVFLAVESRGRKFAEDRSKSVYKFCIEQMVDNDSSNISEISKYFNDLIIFKSRTGDTQYCENVIESYLFVSASASNRDAMVYALHELWPENGYLKRLLNGINSFDEAKICDARDLVQKISNLSN